MKQNTVDAILVHLFLELDDTLESLKETARKGNSFLVERVKTIAVTIRSVKKLIGKPDDPILIDDEEVPF